MKSHEVAIIADRMFERLTSKASAPLTSVERANVREGLDVAVAIVTAVLSIAESQAILAKAKRIEMGFAPLD